MRCSYRSVDSNIKIMSLAPGRNHGASSRTFSAPALQLPYDPRHVISGPPKPKENNHACSCSYAGRGGSRGTTAVRCAGTGSDTPFGHALPRLNTIDAASEDCDHPLMSHLQPKRDATHGPRVSFTNINHITHNNCSQATSQSFRQQSFDLSPHILGLVVR